MLPTPRSSHLGDICHLRSRQTARRTEGGTDGGHRHLRCIWSVARTRSIPRSAFGFTGLPGTHLFCAIVWGEKCLVRFSLSSLALCSGKFFSAYLDNQSEISRPVREFHLLPPLGHKLNFTLSFPENYGLWRSFLKMKSIKISIL